MMTIFNIQEFSKIQSFVPQLKDNKLQMENNNILEYNITYENELNKNIEELNVTMEQLDKTYSFFGNIIKMMDIEKLERQKIEWNFNGNLRDLETHHLSEFQNLEKKTLCDILKFFNYE